MKTYETTIEIETTDPDGNIRAVNAVLVRGELEPACRGTSGLPHPDTEPEMHFLEATYEDGTEANLNWEDEQRAIKALWEVVENEN